MYIKRKIDCLLSYKGGRGLLLGDPDALGTHHSYRQDLGPLTPPHPPSVPLPPHTCAGIFKQSMGARNRVGIGLSYRPSRLHNSLAELVPCNRFLGKKD